MEHSRTRYPFMAKLIKIFFTSLALSIIVLFAFLFIPVTFSNHSELAEVKLGLPFNFIVQDQSHYDPPFPWTIRFLSIWENPTQILWPQFFLSFLIIFFAVFLVSRSLGLFSRVKSTLHPLGVTG